MLTRELILGFNHCAIDGANGERKQPVTLEPDSDLRVTALANKAPGT